MEPNPTIARLKTWFLSKKRDLPWRESSDPYAIWISEVMLQQTRVSVVIPYFIHWMSRFPTIQHVANAPLDDIIKAWEGLGYYSRARNIHEASKYVVENFNGIFPNNESDLKKMKGLGPYTIGAILSFAFHQKKAAVDGNVSRVLTRYYALRDDIGKSTTLNKLRMLAEHLLHPEEEPWIINEALIELGATVCQRSPQCSICPLQSSCEAYNQNLTDQLPINSKKAVIEKLYRAVAILECDSSYLVTRGKKGAIMSDLYEFPYFAMENTNLELDQFQAKIEEKYSLQIEVKKILTEVDHSFTRYQVRLFPVLFSCKTSVAIKDFEWASCHSIKNLSFSSGHRRILQQVLK